MNNNTKDKSKQMENDELDGEMNDREIVLELIESSTARLLYMTEDIRKDIKFYRKAVKINGMAIAWDALDVYDKEMILDAMKLPKGFTFLNCRWRNDE